MEKITIRLQEIFKRNLLALYEYGYTEEKSLIIILKKADFFRLEKARKDLKKYDFVILSEEDLKEGGDVFPVEFLRFQTSVKLLKGKDVLADIKIKPAQLRPHLEYELRNKRIYLRMEYLRQPRGEHFLPLIMPTFEGFLDGLLHLKRVKNLSELSTEEKIEQVQKKYEVDLSVFFQLHAFSDRSVRRRQLVKDTIPAMIQEVDTAFYLLIKKVNNL